MPNPPFKLEIHRILKHYFEDLETVLKQEGLGGRYEALLGELGLCWEDFGEQPGRLEFHHYLSALRLLDAEKQIPGLGLKVGALKHCSTFGFVGLASLTHADLDNLHAFAMRAIELTYGPYLRLKVIQEGSWGISRYEPSPPSLALFAPLIEQTLMTGFHTISEVLPGLDWSMCRARFAFPPPAYVELYAKFIPFPCAFEQPHNELRYPASWNSAASPLADRHVHAFCATSFEAMMAEGRELPSLAQQVRQALMEHFPYWPPRLHEVAARLRLPERSVRSRLAQEQTSFRDILNEVVIERAKEMLTGPGGLTIKEIAFRLGFAQSSNFNRAFAKATGCTPLRYREGAPPAKPRS